MGEPIDQSSFASILAGVQKMRQDYDVRVPEPAEPPPMAPTDVPQAPGAAPQALQETALRVQERHATARAAGGAPAQSTAPGDARISANPSAMPRPDQSLHTSRRAGGTAVHSYTQVQVAQSQKGNPLLDSPQMKLTPWAFNGLILLDYYINATAQVLFLSLKYHKLRPEYVWRRLEKLRGGSSTSFSRDDEALRVLLVVVDIDSPQEVLRKLSVMCVRNDLTMVVAWLFEEAGTYIAALKQNEMARSKINSSIQGARKGDYNSNVVATLTAVRAVNKTDVANLLANCKSFKNTVLQAAAGDGLLGITGLGDRKVKNLAAAFSEPFIFNKEWD